MGEAHFTPEQHNQEDHKDQKTITEKEIDHAIAEFGPKIMTWEKYNSVDKKVRRFPYVFEIEKGKQKLTYFGSQHSKDPKNPQFERLQKEFEDFCRDRNPKDCVVLVEGRARPYIEDRHEAILRGGEGHFIASLAGEKGISTLCPEPPSRYLAESLLKKFTKEEIIYYQFANSLLGWHRNPRRPSFEDHANGRLKLLEKETGGAGFDFSLDHIRAIHEQLFNSRFDEMDKRFFYDVAMPSRSNAVTNEVAREKDTIRNSLMVAGIKHLWDEGKSVFVVYGRSHAIVQEPALRELLM